MIALPLPRWAARIVLVACVWGFVSAVVIMVGLIGRQIAGWIRREGGWN